MEKMIERRHVLIAKFQGDDIAGIVGELRHLAKMIERGEATYGVCGGVSSGCYYAFQENADQTHEGYFAQIEAEHQASTADASAS